VRPSDHISRREEEAAQWFAVVRRGMMTLDEREALEAWRGVPENHVMMERFERSWSALEAIEHQILRPGPAHNVRSVRRARSALVAVLCVVSMGIGVLSLDGHSGFWTTLDWTDR
jgi:ferric-dicitrate binding protein FerR (iron transport regulator)